MAIGQTNLRQNPEEYVMMVVADHPDVLLNQFVTGTLSPQETEQILAHLDQCERCLNQVEQLWEAAPLREAIPLAEENGEIERERAQRIERRVINQIRRTDVAGRALWLGTEGFVQVSFALLRPLLEKLSR